MVGRGRGRHRRRGRGRLPRTLVLLVAVALGGLVAGATPVTEPDSPAGSRQPASTVSVGSGWAGVVASLDRRRASAFTSGSVGALEAVYAAGSAAGRRDRARLKRLVSAGLRVDGLDLRVLDASPVRLDPGRVVLHVVDALAPYRVVDRAGRVAASRPGRAATAWTMTLTWSGSGWRVAEIAGPSPVTDSSARARLRAPGAEPARTRGH